MKLFAFDPSEEVLAAHLLEHVGMILTHVIADPFDHSVVGLTSRHESALAFDEHRHLSHPPRGQVVVPLLGCEYVDETLTGPTVQVCGRLVVVLAGRRREPLMPGRIGRVLFTYLILNRTRDVSSDELVEALWQGAAPPGASATLRTLVSKVRRALGTDVLGRGGAYRLSLPADLQVDLEAALDAIHRAETAIAAGDWARAWGPSQVALFTARRGFLPDEEAQWIGRQRQDLAEIELRALECYAAACLGLGGIELAAAERSARRLVEREPYRESGHRILMRALAAGGNVADALRAYDRLSSLLRDELGVDPGPQTREVHRELLRLTIER
jgi:DNA-binding SARP family transcriptional activator